MVEEQVAAVLGGLDDARVASRPSARPNGPSMPLAQQQLDRLRDLARVRVAVVAERDGAVRRRRGDAGDPGLRPAVEDGRVLGHGDAARGLVERGRSRRRRRRGRRRRARRARPRTARAARPAAAPGAGGRRRPRPGVATAARRGRGSWPSAPSRAGRRSRRACGRRASAARRSRASSSISSQPASVIGASSRSRWFIARVPSGCRCRASRAGERLAAAGGVLVRRPPRPPRRARRCRPPGTGSLGDRAPARGAPEQELEIHAEVLELLALGVAHDRGARRRRARRPGAARTSRSPRPPRSATCTCARTSGVSAGSSSGGSWYCSVGMRGTL